MKQSYIFPILLFNIVSVFSQSFGDDIERVLSDVVFLSENFVGPAADASVYQSTSSWATSAKSLEKFEVDLAFHINVLPIGNGQKSFSVNNSDFQSLVIRGGEDSATIPSALGGDTSTFFDFQIDGEDYELQAFEGVKESVLVHPYLQASVGLWQKTEFTIRYSPKVKIDASDYQIIGGALKHNISQYFNKSKDSIHSKDAFQLAALVSYSKFDLDLFFDEFKLESSNPDPNDVPLATINSIIVDANAWLFQLIGSKRFNKLEYFGALGITSSDFNYKLGGDQGSFLNLFNRALVTLDENKTQFKGDVGLNYHFGKFYLSSMVSIGKFANCNVGLHYKI